MNTTVEFVRKSDAVAELAEALESEAMLAEELEVERNLSNQFENALDTERRRSCILFLLCVGLFLLSAILLAVLFA